MLRCLVFCATLTVATLNCLHKYFSIRKGFYFSLRLLPFLWVFWKERKKKKKAKRKWIRMARGATLRIKGYAIPPCGVPARNHRPRTARAAFTQTVGRQYAPSHPSPTWKSILKANISPAVPLARRTGPEQWIVVAIAISIPTTQQAKKTNHPPM